VQSEKSKIFFSDFGMHEQTNLVELRKIHQPTWNSFFDAAEENGPVKVAPLHVSSSSSSSKSNSNINNNNDDIN